MAPFRGQRRVPKLVAPLVIVAGLALWPDISRAKELLGGVPDDKTVSLDHEQFDGPLLAADKLACVAHITGFDIRWKSYPTNRLLSMASKLELDLIYPMGFSDQRDKTLTRSDYIFLSEDQFVYKQPKPDFSDKAHLHIGVRLGSPQFSVLVDHRFRHIEVGKNYEGLLKMLEAGRLDAIVMPDKLLETFSTAVTQALETEGFYQRQVGFYVGKDWPPDQLTALNAAIVRCRD